MRVFFKNGNPFTCGFDFTILGMVVARGVVV